MFFVGRDEGHSAIPAHSCSGHNYAAFLSCTGARRISIRLCNAVAIRWSMVSECPL